MPRFGPGARRTSQPTGAPPRPESATPSSSRSRSGGSPNCTPRAMRCRTGRPSGAAACRSPNRSCSTRSWPPMTRHDWCWPSSGSTTPRRPCWSRAPRRSAPTSTRDPRRRDLGAGLLRTRGRLRSGEPADHRHDGRATNYVVNGQKLWASGGAHADWCLLLARTDPDAPKRKGHLVLPAGHDHAGYRRAADPQRHRRLALLRDLPQRRRHPGRQPGRRRECRVAGRAGDAGRRARHDDAGTGRAAGQCRLPVAGPVAARSTTRSWQTGWRSSRSS